MRFNMAEPNEIKEGELLKEISGKLYDVATGRPLITNRQEEDRYRYGDNEWVLKSYPSGFRYTDAYRRIQDLIKWDFRIDVLKGDTLESIAEEVYGDKEQWERLVNDNKQDKILRELPLKHGQSLIVYMGFAAAELYKDARPERNLRYNSIP